jgi:hypothetical protein
MSKLTGKALEGLKIDISAVFFGYSVKAGRESVRKWGHSIFHLPVNTGRIFREASFYSRNIASIMILDTYKM